MNIIIKTERAIIREYEIADEKDLIKIASKRYVTDWLPDWLGVEEWAAPWIEGKVKNGYKIDNPMKNCLCYAVVHKETGKLIGNISCGDFQEKEIGIGYFIDEEYSNKGYITEAMSAFCNYLFSRYGYYHLIATIQPANYSSNAVAKKLGFIYVETIEIKDNGQTEVLPFNYYRLDNLVKSEVQFTPKR